MHLWHGPQSPATLLQNTPQLPTPGVKVGTGVWDGMGVVHAADLGLHFPSFEHQAHAELVLQSIPVE